MFVGKEGSTLGSP